MKIAFLSYEFPEETAGGGIGTYLKLISNALTNLGHTVYVFTATLKDAAFWDHETTLRIPAKTWEEFDDALVPHFLELHERINFDIVEGTDFKACGLALKRKLPNIPLIVKLHTPSYLIDCLQFEPLSLKSSVRFIIGGLKRFEIPKLPSAPLKSHYQREFEIIKIADQISSPNHSIVEQMRKLGFEFGDNIEYLPLPIHIDEFLVNIPIKKNLGKPINIVYIGRLEKRKGVYDLIKTIPTIVKKHPQIRFNFIGNTGFAIDTNSIEVWLKKNGLLNYKNNVVLTGSIPHKDVLEYLREGDIFVFPSHYESFGIACCEAMLAGKAVIGSSNGGMRETMDNGKCGIIVPPKAPKAIISAITRLIEDNELRINYGKLAKKRIIEFYDIEHIIDRQIKMYNHAITNSKI